MKHILLLTDFSNSSVNAIHYALNLFSGQSCKFYVLHVEALNAYLSDDLMAGGNASIYDTLLKKPKSKLDALITSLEKNSEKEDFSFEMILDHDVFIDAIKQVIQSKPIDLIVMGTNGVTGAKEVIFGSNTINVIRKINCPTLVIPEAFEFKSPSEVLLPLDMNDAIDGIAFKALLEFTNTYSNRLHLMRIMPTADDLSIQDQDKANISSSLKDINSKYLAVSQTPMDEAVKSYLQTNNIDLITLLVQKETLFERFFIGSSTTEISNTLQVPLLVYHV